jgi:peptidoglycan/LPS O-acetylase OafA/YrhL
VMAGFFAVLILLSLASHHGFERPVQRWLRSRRGSVEVLQGRPHIP